MKESAAIISAYDQACVAGTRTVLATVVQVEGSSYRRAGARMLVDELGNMTGAISGGCLEGDALRKALLSLVQNRNKLVTYDTNDEDDAQLGAQLGCNGVIQVLFEPVDPLNANNPVELLRLTTSIQRPVVLVCLFSLMIAQDQPGTLAVIEEGGQHLGNRNVGAWESLITAEAQEALLRKQSQFIRFQEDQHSLHAFLQVVEPPLALVLVGAGNDTRVLSGMAALLGWDIFIVDGRPSHANPARFEPACQVMVAKPEELLAKVPAHDRTAFVLMTHNYPYDLAVLKLLLAKPGLPYVGLLGPKKKFYRMMEELATDGIRPTEAQLAGIYGPVGLELGAESPAEIALSILAEIQAVFAGAHAVHLRDRQAPIHHQEEVRFKTVIL